MTSPRHSVGRAPCVPTGHRIYAVGDIHGRLDLLDQVLDRIDVDVAARPALETTLVFLGDYIDRGPNSAGVLFRLVEVCATYRTICLMGNHETLLLSFLQDPASLQGWAALGGLTTLQSYGLSPLLEPTPQQAAEIAYDLAQVLPPEHDRFLRSRPLMQVIGDYLFVHAGIRPRRAVSKQTEEDLLWIREDFILYEAPHEKFIIHGHTPVLAPDVRANRINIDTGAYATGRLTCLVLERDEQRFI